MRRAARKDDNHGDIKGVFESLHCSVIDVSGTPCGYDLIVGYGTVAMPVEVKDGAKVPSARKLTENEARAHMHWKGPQAIVTCVDEAIAVAKLLRKRHFAIAGGSVEGPLADLEMP